MSVTVTEIADPSQPGEAATATRPAAPTGPMREASWRSSRLNAGELCERLADLPHHAPVMVDGELLTDADYDGTLHLYTKRTAPTPPGTGLPAAPASVWRSARTELLAVGELRGRLAAAPDFAPVDVDGDPLTDADYDGVLHLHPLYAGAPDEDDDED